MDLQTVALVALVEKKPFIDSHCLVFLLVSFPHMQISPTMNTYRRFKRRWPVAVETKGNRSQPCWPWWLAWHRFLLYSLQYIRVSKQIPSQLKPGNFSSLEYMRPTRSEAEALKEEEAPTSTMARPYSSVNGKRPLLAPSSCRPSCWVFRSKSCLWSCASKLASSLGSTTEVALLPSVLVVLVAVLLLPSRHSHCRYSRRTRRVVARRPKKAIVEVFFFDGCRKQLFKGLVSYYRLPSANLSRSHYDIEQQRQQLPYT